MASPLLTHCPPTLPQEAYLAPDWFAREQRGIWAREWVYVGRFNDLTPSSITRHIVAGAQILLCNGEALTAYHNTCRHRGAELCAADGPLGKLITCPYHAWSYTASDGRLVSVAHAKPTADFQPEDHALHSVAVARWNGFVYVNLSPTPGPLTPDIGLAAFDNWPMGSLLTGHRTSRDLNCNWKVFWENYNECLHCPGIHPELCDMVPVYARGVMSPRETGNFPAGPALKQGAQSWTMTGDPCGPIFPGLTATERNAGYTFATLYPSMFIVAHVDYVRAVSLTPLGPETTRLTAEWLFSAETLAQPGFDPAQTARFAGIVLQQDGCACEMNQRGIRSPAYRQGTLMPQEFDLHAFHHWVLERIAP